MERHEAAIWKERQRPWTVEFLSGVTEPGDTAKEANTKLVGAAKTRAWEIFQDTGKRVHWTRIRDGLPNVEDEGHDFSEWWNE
jgi:hypothetical protein